MLATTDISPFSCIAVFLVHRASFRMKEALTSLSKVLFALYFKSLKLHAYKYMHTCNKMCFTFGNMIYQVTITSNMTAVTGWTLRYHRTGSNDVIMRSHDADDTSYLIMGLEKGTSYTVSVTVNNYAGVGPFTVQMVSTLIDRK